MMHVRAPQWSAMALCLIAGLGLGCHGRPRTWSASATDSSSREREGVASVGRRSQSDIAEIDLTHGAPEAAAPNFLGTGSRQTYFRLVNLLQEIADEPAAHGVLLRFGSARFGWAHAEELAGLLSKLRAAHKQIVCHADGYGNASMWIAARRVRSHLGEPRGWGRERRNRRRDGLRQPPPHREAGHRRRFPADREIQGRRRAVHAQRSEPRSQGVARRGARRIREASGSPVSPKGAAKGYATLSKMAPSRPTKPSDAGWSTPWATSTRRATTSRSSRALRGVKRASTCASASPPTPPKSPISAS